MKRRCNIFLLLTMTQESLSHGPITLITKYEFLDVWLCKLITAQEILRLWTSNFKNILTSHQVKMVDAKKAKNDVQDMSINDPMQKISVKMTFYFSIFKLSILDCLYAFISFTFQGCIRYRLFCCGRTLVAPVKTIQYSKFQIILGSPSKNYQIFKISNYSRYSSM